MNLKCSLFGLIYKKHFTFFIHCLNDVFGLYSKPSTLIS